MIRRDSDAREMTEGTPCPWCAACAGCVPGGLAALALTTPRQPLGGSLRSPRARLRRVRFAAATAAAARS